MDLVLANNNLFVLDLQRKVCFRKTSKLARSTLERVLNDLNFCTRFDLCQILLLRRLRPQHGR